MGAFKTTPAFPSVVNHTYYMGVSARDYFAIHALPAIIAATSAGQHVPNTKHGEHIRFAITREAYDMADAMMVARGLEKPDEH